MPCILMTVSRHVRPAPNHPPGRTPGISAAACLRHFLQYLRTTVYWVATSLPSRTSSITRKTTSVGSAERGWPRGQAHRSVSLFSDIGRWFRWVLIVVIFRKGSGAGSTASRGRLPERLLIPRFSAARAELAARASPSCESRSAICRSRRAILSRTACGTSHPCRRAAFSALSFSISVSFCSFSPSSRSILAPISVSIM